MNSIQFRFSVGEDDVGLRLDVFLAEQEEPPLSRSQVRKYLDGGDISVNGIQVKAGYRLRLADLVVWTYSPPVEPTLTPQAIELSILYEDEHLAIIDKPAGLVIHPAPGHPDQTLVNALTYHFENLSSIGEESFRPGIVHRIDKDTSGALAIAKTDRAHEHLARQFRDHSISRIYHALVFAPGLPDRGSFRTGHGRHPTQRMRYTGKENEDRPAITHFKVLERHHHETALVECRLETGRTHQIRMHLSEDQAPLLGDWLYGGPAASKTPVIARQALHALFLGLENPEGLQVEATAPYPRDFKEALESLRAGKEWR